MLLKCPECELPVSDKALTCPHCGYPMIEEAKPKKKKTKKDHKRLPNGFGQISQLKGRNLRNPYRAMISVGKTSTGRPISKVFGFYETYNDAYTALLEYHKNPYDLDSAITVAELYNRWTEEYFATLKSASSVRTITCAWAYCDSVLGMKAKDIRMRHIESCMNQATSDNMKSRIKSLWNLMLDYALKYELVDRNYARTFTTNANPEPEKEHMSFTNDEMKILWDNIDINYVDIIIFQCYSGFRPQELGLIKLENVDFDNNRIVGGMKTGAGIDRTVPIHSLVHDIVKFRYEQARAINSPYLFNCVEAKTPMLTYNKYRHRFEKIMEVLELNPEHRPHDPRKQFVTMGKEAKMDEYAIKYIAGHKITDITEKTYTDRDPKWLNEEIEKIKGL